MITYHDAINCFTDASTSNRRGITSSCAGYVLVYRGEIIEHGEQILYNTTNNFGEAYAVLMGVQALIRHSSSDKFLNLFSDSKITIEGLRTWCKYWAKNITDDGILLSTSGKPVANQDIMRFIIWIIANARVHLQLSHILGHKDENSIKDIEAQRQNFALMNQTNINTDIARELCLFNGVVDNNTRNILHDVSEQYIMEYKAPVFPVKFNIAGIMDNYLDMIEDRRC